MASTAARLRTRLRRPGLDLASSDLREAGLGDLADRALAAASTAELQDVALATRTGHRR
jgi:hypothetical protein